MISTESEVSYDIPERGEIQASLIGYPFGDVIQSQRVLPIRRSKSGGKTIKEQAGSWKRSGR